MLRKHDVTREAKARIKVLAVEYAGHCHFYHLTSGLLFFAICLL